MEVTTSKDHNVAGGEVGPRNTTAIRPVNNMWAQVAWTRHTKAALSWLQRRSWASQQLSSHVVRAGEGS
jgi:hypothetical protein